MGKSILNVSIDDELYKKIFENTEDVRGSKSKRTEQLLRYGYFVERLILKDNTEEKKEPTLLECVEQLCTTYKKTTQKAQPETVQAEEHSEVDEFAEFKDSDFEIDDADL